MVLEKQIQAYCEKHHLEELPNPRNGFYVLMMIGRYC